MSVGEAIHAARQLCWIFLSFDFLEFGWNSGKKSNQRARAYRRNAAPELLGRMGNMQPCRGTGEFCTDAIILIDKAVAGFQVIELGCLHDA